jgi:hypothetical protein
MRTIEIVIKSARNKRHTGRFNERSEGRGETGCSSAALLIVVRMRSEVATGMNLQRYGR